MVHVPTWIGGSSTTGAHLVENDSADAEQAYGLRWTTSPTLLSSMPDVCEHITFRRTSYVVGKKCKSQLSSST